MWPNTLFMVFAAGLNGLCPVDLLQNHDPGQVVGEGHGAHGEFEIRLLLDPGGHAEGGADKKAGAGFAAELHFAELGCKALAGKLLSLGRKDAEPGPLGDLAEDQLRFLFKTGADLFCVRVCVANLTKYFIAVKYFLFMGCCFYLFRQM